MVWFGIFALAWQDKLRYGMFRCGSVWYGFCGGSGYGMLRLGMARQGSESMVSYG